MNKRVEDLKRRFREALEYINRNNPVQAAEKLYKVAEKAVKILSEINNLPEHKKAQKEGMWWSKLLDKAARKLGKIYGEEILDAWKTALEYHQKGFHEEQLTAEKMLEGAYKIEELIRIVESETEKRSKSRHTRSENQKLGKEI